MKEVILNKVDIDFYNNELAPWLPEEIIDCHVHIGLKEHLGTYSKEEIEANWALEVGIEQSWENLKNTLNALFPNQKVSVLAFGGVFKQVDVQKNNHYLINGVRSISETSNVLAVTKAVDLPNTISDYLSSGFLGIKPYPDLAFEGCDDPCIFDFLPHSHLEVLNDFGGILMLHIPRKDRLKDPDNIKELLEISDKYTNVKMIVAHVGRSFCLPTVQEGLPHFVDRSEVYFDISANLNAEVFEYAINTIGANRILYGSDLPITIMRGIREHVGEKYINYTNEPYSWNTNRKTPEEEEKYTFFIYEELKALIEAVKRTNIGKDGIKKIMHDNIASILYSVKN